MKAICESVFLLFFEFEWFAGLVWFRLCGLVGSLRRVDDTRPYSARQFCNFEQLAKGGNKFKVGIELFGFIKEDFGLLVVTLLVEGHSQVGVEGCGVGIGFE